MIIIMALLMADAQPALACFPEPDNTPSKAPVTKYELKAGPADDMYGILLKAGLKEGLRYPDRDVMEIRAGRIRCTATRLNNICIAIDYQDIDQVGHPVAREHGSNLGNVMHVTGYAASRMFGMLRYGNMPAEMEIEGGMTVTAARIFCYKNQGMNPPGYSCHVYAR